MFSQLRVAAVMCCTMGCVLTVVPAGTMAENLIPNPSFEAAEQGKPTDWKTQAWNGKAEFQYARIGHTGERSVVIISEKGADAAWHTTVAIRPYSTYRLSGWIRTENVEATTGRGVLLNLHNLQEARTRALTGTNDWTRVEIVFDTAENDSVQINCLLGGWGLATGRAWYDDVRLVLLSIKNLKPSVTIDTTKTREPISKYIYGQFIEHLGRCIYGGIWAEMLEDRKFFDPVGDEKSPWKAIGGEAFVEMERENSFVGEHTPRVRLAGDGSPCGIVQDALALREDHNYVGRIVLAGTGMSEPIKVSLVWGPGQYDRQTVTISDIANEFVTSPLRFTADESTDDGRLEIVSQGRGGEFRIGAVSLMPANNVHGMRADTLKLLKELDAPIYRWPGGNFVSGYDWKDGIGDRDRRPPRKNPAWKGIEHNDFGLDEFIVFCRELKTEPLIVVNSGQGDAKLAAEEVEYANGGRNTPMGRLRAANGHREPYNVEWWGVGNEMYGKWQLGHMPLEEYVKKHNIFAEAMRAVDPSIKLVAVGALGRWSEQTLVHCAEHMDLISEHFYNRDQKGLLSHVRQIPNNVRRKAEGHRRYRKTIPSLAGKDIRIALDEWNYWYGPHLYGELGVRYYLRDALGIAAGLNELSRSTDIIFMANYAQTVNVIGCIKTNKTDAVFATTGLALKLYRHHFGAIPVEASGAPEPLDVAAAWTEDRKALTVAIVNPTRQKLELALDLKGVSLTGAGRLWRIAGPNEMAYNEPGKEPQVRIEEEACEGLSRQLEVPPSSVSLYVLEVGQR